MATETLFEAPAAAEGAPAPEAAPAVEVNNEQDDKGVVIDVNSTPATEALATFNATEVPADVLGGKYKTTEDLVKGLSESTTSAHALLEKLKGFTGAPVNAETGEATDYDFSEVEGFADFTPDENLMGVVNEIGRETGASQEVMSRLLGEVYMPALKAALEGNATEERALLAENFGSEDLSSAACVANMAWAAETMPEADSRYGETSREDIIKEVGASASGHILMSVLKDQFTKAPTLPINLEPGTPAYGEPQYLADLDNAGRDPDAADRVAVYATAKAARQAAG